MTTSTKSQDGYLKSTFPVMFPTHPALSYSQQEFEAFLEKHVEVFAPNVDDQEATDDVEDDTSSTADPSVTTTIEVVDSLEGMGIEPKIQLINSLTPPNQQPFMDAIHDTADSSDQDSSDRDMDNIMQTQNADLAHRSTQNPLVDLFFELEDVVSGLRLGELLESAWQKDSLMTLKIIFNARSIHLGKSSRTIMYKCFGWLAHHHPATLLVNLQWLARPVVEKKMVEKKEGKDEGEDDMVMVEKEEDQNDPHRFDVKNGVAHGYWKDLLNILTLAAGRKLDVMADPRDMLNVQSINKKSNRVWDAEKAKEKRQGTKVARHTAAIKLFEDHSFYRALHITVARLFADQLKSDLKLLRSDDKKALRQISLCAKWAPSQALFHDKHTFIVSTIAELLHPQLEFADVSDRQVYLRHAREAYRKDVSALRKQLEVVERDIAATTFENIKYDRVPSLAMNRYAGLFAKKDFDRFDSYIDQVAEGKKSISGATLLPSTLVSRVRGSLSGSASRTKQGNAKAMVEAKLANVDAKVLDGQWNTLVQRIKDSGKLENSIAVADVSGSMMSPTFADGSCPMDSSIGLSLLLAEITNPPFGGSFITFSTEPKVERIEGNTLQERVRNLESAEWGMSTNFVGVFDRLILPLAKKHNVKQEDMVKQIFVFSDMQFDAAAAGNDQWTTSYERIKKDFTEAGYEMPKLIFWNLAGGRAGMTGGGDATAPKPVTAEEEGTSLVSGYSQGMLKVFLDNGAFEDPDAEEEIVEEDALDDDGEELVQVRKKVKQDPMSTVRKAISHKAYSMLKVVDSVCRMTNREKQDVVFFAR